MKNKTEFGKKIKLISKGPSFTYHSDGHVLFKWAVRLAVETASSPKLSTCKLEWEQSSVSSFVSGLFQILMKWMKWSLDLWLQYCLTLCYLNRRLCVGLTNSKGRIKSAIKCLETSGMGWKRHRNQICVWWRGYMNCGQEMFTNSLALTQVWEWPFVWL